MHTVLEIGSGSYKLHRNNDFTEKYQSSLGRDMLGNALAEESVHIALDSLDNHIIPFLLKRDIELASVKVFATAAVRKAMNDPKQSGLKFVMELIDRGFDKVRVFTEEQECTYAALGVIEEMQELQPKLKDFCMLDTGGASHQLVQVSNTEIQKQVSIPLGSHSDLETLSEQADFIKHGFQPCQDLVLIGTSGQILSAIAGIDTEFLSKLKQEMLSLDITGRRALLANHIDQSELITSERKKKQNHY